jgi:hypothetical protein
MENKLETEIVEYAPLSKEDQAREMFPFKNDKQNYAVVFVTKKDKGHNPKIWIHGLYETKEEAIEVSQQQKQVFLESCNYAACPKPLVLSVHAPFALAHNLSDYDSPIRRREMLECIMKNHLVFLKYEKEVNACPNKGSSSDPEISFIKQAFEKHKKNQTVDTGIDIEKVLNQRGGGKHIALAVVPNYNAYDRDGADFLLSILQMFDSKDDYEFYERTTGQLSLRDIDIYHAPNQEFIDPMDVIVRANKMKTTYRSDKKQDLMDGMENVRKAAEEQKLVMEENELIEQEMKEDESNQ